MQSLLLENKQWLLLEDKGRILLESTLDRREKNLRYKFYDIDGNYIDTVNGSDFKDYPTFTIDINGGLSEMRLSSSFSFQDWNYPPDGLLTYPWGVVPPEGYTGAYMQGQKGIERLYNGMYIGYKVKVFVDDRDGEVQIYSGIYAGLELNYSENGEKEFIHHFIPNISQLSARIFKSGTDTTVLFSSVDPSSIFRAIIDDADVGITYNSDSVNDTGVSRTYEFVVYTALEALNQSIQLTPNRWIWFIGGDDLLYLRNIDQHGTTHIIALNACKSMKFEKSIAYIRNSVLFLGGGSPQLYNKYDITSSQNSWGLWEEKIIDERVSDNATAEIIANRFLADRQSATNYFTLEIMDSNFSELGYNIESLKPGDQIMLHSQDLDFSVLTWGNFTWGVDFWKYDFYSITGIPSIIRRITYKYDSVIVECSFNFEQQNQRIEDIKRDLTNYRFKDAPTTPA